jgi:siroheme synthase-like protein
MFINLENKKVIVLGGGRTALRKVNTLLHFNCKIAVIAPKICDELKNTKKVSTHEMNLAMEVLDNADMVVAATSKDDINIKIGNYCNAKKIPVNVADNPELSSFLFPGIVARDDLIIGITTGGKSPSISKEIRSMIDRFIPQEYGNLTRKMAAYREIVMLNIKDSYLREMALEEIVKMAINHKCILDDKKANKIIEKYAREDAERR